MKKLFVLALIAAAFTAGRNTTEAPETTWNTYCLTGYVSSLNSAKDIVTVTTKCNGYTWEFSGIEDWEVFDRCELILQDVNETPEDCTDDVIVGCTYRS